METSSQLQMQQQSVQQLDSGIYSAENSARSVERISQNTDVLTQDSILKHHVECKVENKMRLKQVKNLEDLINFRIKTVSDKLIEEGTLVNKNSKKKGLYSLRKVVDPLLTSKAFPAVTKSGYSHGQRKHDKDPYLNLESLNEDSIMLDNAGIQEVEEANAEGELDTKQTFVDELVKNSGIVTKTEMSRVMSDTGTILLEKKTVNQQIDDILRLDDRDPIRKLQMYFKDTPYGHEYDDEGMRMPRKYKAPKHKNHIMQRYENARQRDALKRKESQEQGPRAFSQMTLDRSDLHNRSHQSSKFDTTSRNDNIEFSINLPYNQSLDIPSQRYASQKAIKLKANYLYNADSIAQSELQQMSFGPMQARMQSLRAGMGPGAGVATQQVSEKKLLQTNFMTQLKHLQDVLKGSMLDAVDGNDSQKEENKLDMIESKKESRKESEQSLLPLINDQATTTTLENNKALSVQRALSIKKKNQQVMNYRRKSTLADMKLLDDIKASGNETKDMIDKYMPVFQRNKVNDLNQTKSEDSPQNKGHVNEIVIGEASSESSKVQTGQSVSVKESHVQSKASFNAAARESIEADLLQGVDSDEDVLEQLARGADEIQKLEESAKTKKDSAETQKIIEYQKLRQLLAMNMSTLVDLSSLTPEQRSLIKEVSGKNVSALSKFANIQRKDYVEYSQDQMAVYKLLNGQNDSQKRIMMLQQRRKNYNQQRDRSLVQGGQSVERRLQHSAEGRMGTNHNFHNSKQQRHSRQPFSNKKFVEDISKPAFDFKKNKIAERLPQIKYGSTSQITKQRGQQNHNQHVMEMQSKPETKSQMHSYQMVQRIDVQDDGVNNSNHQRQMRAINSKNTILLGSSHRSNSNQHINVNNFHQNYNHNDSAKGGNQQQIILSKRIPVLGSNNNTFGTEKQSLAHDSDIMRVSGVSPFRNTQKDSETSTRSKAEKIDFKYGSNIRQTEGAYQGNDAMAQLSKEFDLQGKSVMELKPEEYSTDLKEVKSEQRLDGLPTTNYLKNADETEESSQNIKSVTKGDVSDNGSADQINPDTLKIGSKIIQQERIDSPKEPVDQQDLESKRLKISLDDDDDNLKKKSAIDSLQPSDSVYNYDIISPSLQVNFKENSLAQQKRSVEPYTGQPLSNNATIAHITKSNNNLLSNSVSQKESLVYHESINTEHKMSQQNMNQEDSKQETSLENNQNEELRNSTAKLLIDQAKNYSQENIMNSSDQFHVIVAGEQDRLNQSTETLQTGPNTREQKRERELQSQKQVELDQFLSKKKKQSKFQEADVPQNIKIRHQAITNQNSQTDLSVGEQSSVNRRQIVMSNSGREILIEKKDSSTEIMEAKAFSRNKNANNQGSGLALLKEHVLYPSDKLGGYETAQDSVDPHQFAFMKDIAESVQQRVQQKGWHAKRFKKFPRFSIYLQRDQTNSYMESNYISLNNKMLEFLAEKEPDSKKNTAGAADEMNVSQDSIESDQRNVYNTTGEVMLSKEISSINMDTHQTRRGDLMQSTVEAENSIEIDLAHKTDTTFTKDKTTLHQPNSVIESTVKNTPENLKEKPGTVSGTETLRASQEIKMNARVKFQNQNTMKNAAAGTTDSKQSRQSSNHHQNAVQNGYVAKDVALTTNTIDPFDRVLLLKNIDNAILTSFRTLTKQNNVVSHTLKVIHNKFTPKQLSKTVKRTYQNTQKQLYSVSEVEDFDDYQSEGKDEGDGERDHTESRREIITIHQPQNIDLPAAQTDNPATVNEYTSQHTATHNDPQESLISSIEMSPKVARLAKARIIKQPNSLEHSKEKLPQPYNVRASLEAQTAESQRFNQQNKLESTLKRPPGTRGDDVSTPATLGGPNDQVNITNYQRRVKIMDAPVDTTHSQGNHFKDVEEHKRTTMNKLRLGDSTFTDKQRATGQFGGALVVENSNLDLNSTGHLDSKGQLHYGQFVNQIGTQESELKGKNSIVTSSDQPIKNNIPISKLSTLNGNGNITNKPDVTSTLRNTQIIQQEAELGDAGNTSDEGVALQQATFKLSNDDLKTMSKRDSQENKDHIALRIPNAQKEQTSTSQFDQKYTEPDVAVDKILYQQFGGSKIDSQRSVVPQAAGSRQRKLSTGKPTDETRKDQQTPIRIRNANVEEFLGDYNTKPHLLHPSFKTSKIILQVKGNSNSYNMIKAGKMKDQGVDNRSVSTSAYGRDMSNQVAMNTMTTFANMTGKSQTIHGRRSSNESREPSQTSQNAITKSIYGGGQPSSQERLQTLEEEKTKREGNAEVQENEWYKHKFNQIIDSVSHIHGKKHHQPKKNVAPKRYQQSNKAKQMAAKTSRISMQLLNSSNETVSNRDLSEDKIYVLKADNNNGGVDHATTGKTPPTKSFQNAVTGKTSMLNGIEEQKKLTGGTFDQTSQDDLIRKETLKIPLIGLQSNDNNSSKEQSKPVSINASKDGNAVLTQQPSTRNQNTESAFHRVETANVSSHIKDYKVAPLVITSKNNVLGKDSSTTKTNQQVHFTETDTPSPVPKLDHMLVKNSPSYASNVDSSVRLVGKMQHSNVAHGVTQISPDHYTQNRNSGAISQTYDGLQSGDQSVRIQSNNSQTMPSHFMFQQDQSQQQRHTALIKKGEQEAKLLESIVSVPQPEKLLVASEQVQKVPSLAASTGKAGIRNQGFSIQSKQQLATLRKEHSTESMKDMSTVRTNEEENQLSSSQSPQRKYMNSLETEHHEIASRIVQPKPAHRVRQMIDTLCLKEKSFIYQNPNLRDECIGTQNSIFDLSNSHLVDRPGLYSQQERMVNKNMNALRQEANFEGASFLAGTKANIQRVVRKPTDIRR